MLKTLSICLLLAIVSCSACSQGNHSRSQSSTDVNSLAYQMAGMDAEMNGKYEDALKLFDTSINLDHNNLNAYQGRATTEGRLHHYKEAISDIDEAIKLLPHDYAGSLQRGDFIMFRGDWKSFLKQNNEAEKDYRASIQEYSNILKLHPEDSRTLERRSNIEERLKDYKSAISDMTTAVKYSPKEVFYYLHLAELKGRVRDYNGAIEVVNEALKLNEQRALVYSSRGGCYYQLKDYKNAIKDYDQSLLLDSSSYVALYYRGLVKLSLNDKNGACNDWNAALKKGFQPADSLLKANCK